MSKCIKALVLDDDAIKGIKITRALKECGVKEVISVEDQESGFEKVYQEEKKGQPFTLIVTDMHYPVRQGVVADPKAGLKLIERVKEEGLDIPIIVCSSDNFQIENILGTVWYSEIRDLREDFMEVLKEFRR